MIAIIDISICQFYTQIAATKLDNSNSKGYYRTIFCSHILIGGTAVDIIKKILNVSYYLSFSLMAGVAIASVIGFNLSTLSILIIGNIYVAIATINCFVNQGKKMFPPKILKWMVYFGISTSALSLAALLIFGQPAHFGIAIWSICLLCGSINTLWQSKI